MQKLIEELTRLERDVQLLSKDSRRRLLRDDAIAAEFVATEETIENAGSVLEALLRLRDVHESYWRMFFADHAETLNALRQSRSPVDLLRVGFDHWSRLTTHAADGFTQTFNVLTGTGRSLSSTFVEMWSPFVELVRRDGGVRR